MYLDIRKLNFAYGSDAVLHDVSFSIDRGEIVGLIGANGAGKTTTICNVMKKLKPQSGQIFLDGKNLEKWKRTNFPISYIPDTPVYYEELTMSEHFNFVQALYPHTSTNIEMLISRFELQQHLNKVPGLLSKGTLQKMMMVIALLRDFNVLLADEPINGLDPKQISVFKEVLRELRNEDKAILLSTHLLDMAEGICDRYVMMDHGSVIGIGTQEKLRQQADCKMDATLEEIYLSMIR